MPIPRKSVPIRLTAATPTALTPDNLQHQLNNIGLTCEHTDPERLRVYIDQIESGIPDGRIQTYAILRPTPAGAQSLDGLVGDWAQSSVGNWQPDSTAIGYAADLQYLVFEEHFAWLQDNRPSFTGTRDTEGLTERFDTVDAVKLAFAKLATTASSALVKGLDKESVESVFSNVIDPLDDKGASNYDKSDSRVIFLVENYDEETRSADAVGVLGINWHLVVKDYKKKDKDDPKHDTSLTVDARAVLYGDLATMEADLQAARAHFKGRSFGGAGYIVQDIPAKDTSVEIYATRPPADATTFRRSLPLVADSQKAQVIVLFAPDLQSIGSVDNTRSQATSTYEKSVSTGFTFSMSQEINVSSEFEAGIVIAKGKVTVGFSLSFTEEWNTTTTETLSFAVPPGELAFTYQGTLRSQILEYDPAVDRYTYRSQARFLSPVMATTNEPIASGAVATVVATPQD